MLRKSEPFTVKNAISKLKEDKSKEMNLRPRYQKKPTLLSDAATTATTATNPTPTPKSSEFYQETLS